MTESEAIVTRVEGDYLWLDSRAGSGCASCQQSSGCGLSDGKGRPGQRLRNTVGARVGDTVCVSVPGGAVMRAVFHSYLLPLAWVLGGAAVGMWLAGDAAAVLGGVAGLIAGWLSLRLANDKLVTAREPLLTLRIKENIVYPLQRNPLP